MKISLNLTVDDIAELDHYVEEHTLGSRSEGIRQAIRFLRAPVLIAEYALAFQESGGLTSPTV